MTVKPVNELFDKTFDNHVRLQLMGILMANESYDFNSLKDLLKLSDGGLAAHIKVLEKEGYVSIMKTFLGKKPNTRYKVTKKGIKAFQSHLLAMERFIKESQKGT